MFSTLFIESVMRGVQAKQSVSLDGSQEPSDQNHFVPLKMFQILLPYFADTLFIMSSNQYSNTINNLKRTVQ